MATYVVGDVHGQREQVQGLLRRADLIDTHERWSGGDATLWFIGDFFDRGPDGIGVVDLVMQLERDARASGGQVHALLGNHEVLFLAAYYFGDRPSGGPGGTFKDDWLENGGQISDLERLQPHHVTWISDLPAVAYDREHLYIHADARFYEHYGRSVDEVNRAFYSLLHSREEAAWDKLLEQFSDRFAFLDRYGVRRVEQMLRTFGGRQIIHGHTPIWKMTDLPAGQITEAYVYANGLCVNVDGGMVTGGPGFVYHVPPLAEPF